MKFSYKLATTTTTTMTWSSCKVEAATNRKRRCSNRFWFCNSTAHAFLCVLLMFVAVVASFPLNETQTIDVIAKNIEETRIEQVLSTNVDEVQLTGDEAFESLLKPNVEEDIRNSVKTEIETEIEEGASKIVELPKIINEELEPAIDEKVTSESNRTETNVQYETLVANVAAETTAKLVQENEENTALEEGTVAQADVEKPLADAAKEEVNAALNAAVEPGREARTFETIPEANIAAVTEKEEEKPIVSVAEVPTNNEEIEQSVEINEPIVKELENEEKTEEVASTDADNAQIDTEVIKETVVETLNNVVPENAVPQDELETEVNVETSENVISDENQAEQNKLTEIADTSAKLAVEQETLEVTTTLAPVVAKVQSNVNDDVLSVVLEEHLSDTDSLPAQATVTKANLLSIEREIEETTAAPEIVEENHVEPLKEEHLVIKKQGVENEVEIPAVPKVESQTEAAITVELPVELEGQQDEHDFVPNIVAQEGKETVNNEISAHETVPEEKNDVNSYVAIIATSTQAPLEITTVESNESKENDSVEEEGQSNESVNPLDNSAESNENVETETTSSTTTTTTTTSTTTTTETPELDTSTTSSKGSRSVDMRISQSNVIYSGLGDSSATAHESNVYLPADVAAALGSDQALYKTVGNGVGGFTSNRSTLIIASCAGVAVLFIIVSITIFAISFQRQHGTLDIEMQEQRCGKDDLNEEDAQLKLLEIELPQQSNNITGCEETDECL